MAGVMDTDAQISFIVNNRSVQQNGEQQMSKVER